MLNRKRAAGRIGIGLIAVCATALTSACAAGKQAQTADEVPAIDGVTSSVGQMQLHMFALRPPDNGVMHPVGSDVRVELVLVNQGRGPDTLTDVSTPAAAGWGIYASSAAASRVERADNPASTSAASTPAPSTPAPTGSSSSAQQPGPGSSSTTQGSDEATGTNTSGSPEATSTTGSTAASAATSAAPNPPPVGAKSIKIPAGKTVAFGTPSATKVMLLLNLSKKLYPGTSIPITVTFEHAGTKKIIVPVQLTDGTSRLTLPPGSESPEPI